MIAAPPTTARRMRGDDGLVALEWVIVFPAVLFVVFLAVQYGLWANYKDIAIAAVQDAATDFASAGVPSRGRAQAAVMAYLDAYGGSELDDVDVDVVVSGGADTVTVTLSAEAPAVFDAASLPVRARATVAIERFRP